MTLLQELAALLNTEAVAKALRESGASGGGFEQSLCDQYMFAAMFNAVPQGEKAAVLSTLRSLAPGMVDGMATRADNEVARG